MLAVLFSASSRCVVLAAIASSKAASSATTVIGLAASTALSSQAMLVDQTTAIGRILSVAMEPSRLDKLAMMAMCRVATVADLIVWSRTRTIALATSARNQYAL